MPKILIVSGPIFALYIIFNIGIGILAGEIYTLADIFYSFIELLYIVFSISVAYCYVRILKEKDTTPSLFPISFIIVMIMISYWLAITGSNVILPFLKNIIGFEINIDALIRNIDLFLGFRRLYGPLGGSASLGILLIPILGYSLYQLKEKFKFHHFVLLLLSVLLAFFTGSRVAIFGVLALLLLFFLTRHFILSYVLILALSGFLLYLSLGPPSPNNENIYSPNTKPLLDKKRIAAIKTSLNAGLSSSRAFLFGVGYKELGISAKKRFLTAASPITTQEYIETEYGIIAKGPYIILDTEYGFMPGGPHSIFNWVFAKTGLIGLILRLSFIYVFVFFLFRQILKGPHKSYLIMVTAVFISFSNLFTDECHIADPMLMTCWFVFYIYAYEKITKKISDDYKT